MTLFFKYLVIIIITSSIIACNAVGVKEEICAGQKDVMRKLNRDGKLCNGAENWNTWFHLNFPGCGENIKWTEHTFNNDGVKLVKKEHIASDKFIRGLSGVYEKEQKTEMKEMYFLNSNVGKAPLVEKGKQLQVVQKRRLDDSSRGRELLSEWDGTANTGSFNLVRNVTKTSGTITVNGVLDIIGIVGDDGVKPAIDGGNTPGCGVSSNCPFSSYGRRVFYLDTANDELRLTNITIQNGYTVRFLILFSHF